MVREYESAIGRECPLRASVHAGIASDCAASNKHMEGWESALLNMALNLGASKKQHTHIKVMAMAKVERIVDWLDLLPW